MPTSERINERYSETSAETAASVTTSRATDWDGACVSPSPPEPSTIPSPWQAPHASFGPHSPGGRCPTTRRPPPENAGQKTGCPRTPQRSHRPWFRPAGQLSASAGVLGVTPAREQQGTQCDRFARTAPAQPSAIETALRPLCNTIGCNGRLSTRPCLANHSKVVRTGPDGLAGIVPGLSIGRVTTVRPNSGSPPLRATRR